MSERIDYKTYLQSKYWKEFRAKIISARKICEECGTDKKLQVHHLNYDRLHAELPEDVRLLCEGCHQAHHVNYELKHLSGGFFHKKASVSEGFLKLISECPAAAAIFYYLSTRSRHRPGDENWTSVHLSIENIGKACNIGRSSTHRGLKQLAERGFIIREEGAKMWARMPFWLVWHGEKPDSSLGVK